MSDFLYDKLIKCHFHSAGTILLAKVEHFSLACSLWQWPLLVSHSVSQKEAKGLWLCMWGSCDLSGETYLVRNFPVVMTCLYPLAHLSPLRLRNTISKLFNRAPTAVTEVLLIEQINFSANCFPKMSLIKIWCDVVTQCWFGTVKGSLLLFHCHIPTHKSDVTFCQHYSRQLSLFSPVLILCAVPVLKLRSCLMLSTVEISFIWMPAPMEGVVITSIFKIE